jgi:hypothetical protein
VVSRFFVVVVVQLFQEVMTDTVFLNFLGAKIDSASLCSLVAGQYDNPIPTRFLALIDCYKIPAQKSYICSRNLSYFFRNIDFLRTR